MISVANDRGASASASASADVSLFRYDSSMAPSNVKLASPPAGEKSRVLMLDSPRGGGRVLEVKGERFTDAGAKKSSGRSLQASWMNGFEVGDLVWGKVKSHPWWPGHIYNEAFASRSVRGLKKEGQVLVAFFGDSSYGWFEPVELLPFEPHFADKSRQTTSRTFVTAIEEAIDEVSLRASLGVACYCKNKNNFRPATVPDYFAVKVPGFDFWENYSSRQIREARDGYVPVETLSFLQMLALSPRRNSPTKSVEGIQKISLLLAYRRAKFEDFDPTYAEAFGVEPQWPSKDESDSPDQSDRCATRAAPLSGPLVIAEKVSKKKAAPYKPAATKPQPSISSSSSSSSSSKKKKKKNKYLLKRREETPNTNTNPNLSNPLPTITTPPHGTTTSNLPFNLSPGPEPQASIVIPSLQAFREAAGASQSNLDQHMLQKRTPMEEPHITIKKHKDKSMKKHIGLKLTAESAQKKPAQLANNISKSAHSVSKSSKIHSSNGKSSSSVGERALESEMGDTSVDNKLAYKSEMVDASVDSKLPPPPPPPPPKVVLIDGQKVRKRSPDQALDIKKKKKKLKRIDTLFANGTAFPVDFDPKKKQVEKPIDKTKQQKVKADDVNLIVIDDDVDLKKKDAMDEMVEDKAQVIDDTITPMDVEEETKKECISKPDEANHQSLLEAATVEAHFPPKEDLKPDKQQLPDLVEDLMALALDPFYGVERNVPDQVLHAILRYRNLVYKKSLVVPVAADESEEPPTKLPEQAPTKAINTATLKNQKGLNEPGSSLKPIRPPSRSDDPTIAGRKRLPSDRQEEKSAKKLKKLSKLKSLVSEKKKSLMSVNQNDPTAAAASQSKKPQQEAEPVRRKQQPPQRPPSNTFLVMKFPPNTKLPSINFLKAKFGRFGELDPTRFRVYWKSHTCKVLFVQRAGAEAALHHANCNDLFMGLKVNYKLREADLPAAPALPMNGLKSILKKPGSSISNKRLRVRFRDTPLSLPSKGHRMRDLSPPPPPPPPPRPLISHPRPQHSQVPFPQVSRPTEKHSYEPRAMQTESSTTDFAVQMLSLMHKCRDVVNNVKSSLGYLPYHPI